MRSSQLINYLKQCNPVWWWVMFLQICFCIESYANCAYVHLDKNYLFAGENLSGTLLTNQCQIFPQVRIAILDQNGQRISQCWIRLDSSIQPFALEIPAIIPEGLYQMVVVVERSLEVIYWQTMPIFTTAMEQIRISEAGPPPKAMIATEAIGLSIDAAAGSGDQELGLQISPLSGTSEYVKVSVLVSDFAQSVPSQLPTQSQNGSEVDNRVPLSSHTFALEGYLSDSSGTGCSYCQVILTLPGLENGVFYTKTDNTGSFAFTGLSHSGTLKGYLSYQPEASAPGMSFFVHQRAPQFKTPDIPESFQEYKQALTPKIQRYRLTRRFKTSQSYIQQVSTEKPIRPYQEIILYPKADEQILFEEYYLGVDMRRTIKSIVPFVSIIKKTQMRVFSVENSRTFELRPLILLDGIPINSERALSIDPRTIFKVEVLHRNRSLRQVGNIASNGIVSFFTKNGTDEMQIPGVKKIYIQGFDNRNPEVLTAVAKDPFDRVLYWNPSVEIKSNSNHLISIPLPNYYAELMISIVGVDAYGEYVFYQGLVDF